MASIYRRKYVARTGETRVAAKFTVEFSDHRGIERRLTGFADKGASAELGRRVEKLARLRAAGEAPPAELSRWAEVLPDSIREPLAKFGVLDAAAVASGKPLAEHLVEFEAALRDSGATAEYVKKTATRIRAVVDAVGARLIGDLTAGKVSRYLAGRRGKPRSAGGLSIKSANHYAAASKQFIAWMVRERRAAENPLAELAKLNPETDRRHLRRALEAGEIVALLHAAKAAPERFGIDGESRAWLYRVAAETGLRAGELCKLVRADLVLDGPRPSVTVRAENAKNGHARTVPLKPETADGLRVHLRGKLPTARVFKFPRPENVVKMLRGDLSKARIAWLEASASPAERSERAGSPYLAYRDDAGRVADFHALRATFASNLIAAGVDVKTAQELLGHADPKMTLGVYAKVFRGSVENAVARLPSYTTPEREAAKRTGTYDAPATCTTNLTPEAAFRGVSGHDAALRLAGATDRETRGFPREIGGFANENGPSLDGPGCTPPRGFEPLSPI